MASTSLYIVIHIIEIPSSDNFYINKFYDNDLYPLWGQVKGWEERFGTSGLTDSSPTAMPETIAPRDPQTEVSPWREQTGQVVEPANGTSGLTAVPGETPDTEMYQPARSIDMEDGDPWQEVPYEAISEVTEQPRWRAYEATKQWATSWWASTSWGSSSWDTKRRRWTEEMEENSALKVSSLCTRRTRMIST